MGSVGFDGEVEYQPSTTNCKKYKLPRTLLVGCGVVNHASSVPRKLRSAIKKRARESITSPLSISKKQRHVSNRVDTLKKDSAKKSKRKRGHITKDEEEVVETLYALATMFSDTKTGSNDEPTDTKSSAVLEAGSSINAVEDNGIPTRREESKKISSKVTLDVTCHSPNLLNSKAQIVKLQSSSGAQKPKLSSSKQTSSPGGYGVESDLRLLPIPRLSSEHVIDLEQVTTSGAQYGDKYYPMNDKYKGLFQSPTGTQSSKTHGSCLRDNRLPAWFESTNFATQPPVIENSITTGKCAQVAVLSKESWKRSLAHVYISHLIKVLQISESKEGSPEKPTQLTTCGGAHQMTGINGRKSGVSFNGIIDYAAEKDSAGIENDIFLHKSLIQDRQLATENSALCSAKVGYDFLSLGTEVCGLDASGGVNRAGHCHESPKQFHASYLQSQNHPSVLFSLPQNGHNSAQVYLSSTVINGSFRARMERQLEMQHRHKWPPYLPDWKNEKADSSSMVNCAQALFPHLHSTLGSKYQQFSPSQQFMSINSTLPLPTVNIHKQHHFPLGFKRNGAAFYSDNITQHLSNGHN